MSFFPSTVSISKSSHLRLVINVDFFDPQATGQWIKVFVDEILPSYVGIYNKPWHKDPQLANEDSMECHKAIASIYIQPGFNGSLGPFFFRTANKVNPWIYGTFSFGKMRKLLLRCLSCGAFIKMKKQPLWRLAKTRTKLHVQKAREVEENNNNDYNDNNNNNGRIESMWISTGTRRWWLKFGSMIVYPHFFLGRMLFFAMCRRI